MDPETTENETQKGHGQFGAWANLVICGGLSWGVNFWHATHATSAGAHVGTGLALLCATGPVVSAGFASHNMARSGGGNFKKAMTYLVFAMGMALSITAQAEAVEGVFGNIYLGVTFALVLDLSAFMSLHSIMTAPAAQASAETPAGAPVAVPVQAPVRPPVVPPVGAPAGPPVGAPVDRLPIASRPPAQAALEAPAAPPVKAPASRPKKTRKAEAPTPKMTREEAKARTRELLRGNPEMAAPAIAKELGKAPTSGYVRDIKKEVLEEMVAAGELPSVRSIGA